VVDLGLVRGGRGGGGGGWGRGGGGYVEGGRLMVAVVKEGKSKIISRSNSGVLTWPTTAAVKISPFELPLLLPRRMPGQEA